MWKLVCSAFLVFQAVYVVWLKEVFFSTNVSEQILIQNITSYTMISIMAAILFAFTAFLIYFDSRFKESFVIATVVTHFLLITIIPALLNYENEGRERPVPPQIYIITEVAKIVQGQVGTSVVTSIFGIANAIMWLRIEGIMK